MTRPRKGAPQKIWVFMFFGPVPGDSGAPSGLSVGVSGTSGALPEAPGTHHEPTPKTYEPKRLDEAIRDSAA